MLNIGRASVGQQKQRGIGVSRIVRVADPQPRRPTHPCEECLDLSLAEGPNTALGGINEE